MRMSQKNPNFKPGDFVIFKATNELNKSNQSYPVWDGAQGLVLESHDISENHLCGYYIIEWTLPITNETVQDELILWYENFLHRDVKKYRDIKIKQLLTKNK